MIRGTTPIHVITTDVDISDAEVVYVTYQQGSRKIEKTKDDLTFLSGDKFGFELKLSQEDTLEFESSGKDVEFQVRVRFLSDSGKDNAFASNIIKIPVSKILKGGVI